MALLRGECGMTEKFKPSCVRDRNVILDDIAYAEMLLKKNPNNEELKRAIKECEDELSYTKPSLFERIFKR